MINIIGITISSKKSKNIPAPLADWILDTGYWDDAGNWIDSSVWNDN